jgi:exonuclease III
MKPGPKFEHKLAWFDRLIEHAAGLSRCGHPVVMAGDYNVVPTDFDIYSPAPAPGPGALPAASAAGLDRFDPPVASAGSGVHLLGLFS